MIISIIATPFGLIFYHKFNSKARGCSLVFEEKREQKQHKKTIASIYCRELGISEIPFERRL
jgi:hypothetical protein